MIAAGFFTIKTLLKVTAWAVVILAIAGSIAWTVNYFYQTGYVSGNDASESRWEKKHAKAMELKAYNYKTLLETLRNRETEFGEIVDALAGSHNEDQKNAERGREMAVDAALTGAFKLYDPTRKWQGTGQRANHGGNGTEAKLPGTAPGSDGAAEGELSPEFTAFLAREAIRADGTTDKLTKLQVYTRELFKQCSGRKLLY